MNVVTDYEKSGFLRTFLGVDIPYIQNIPNDGTKSGTKRKQVSERERERGGGGGGAQTRDYSRSNFTYIIIDI